MSAENQPAFIKVDELMPKVTLEQVLAFYGVTGVELLRNQTRGEIRSRCFLRCGRAAETGDRALAIQEDHPARQWKCFEQGCGKGGNLVSLCDLLKPGQSGGGRPRGERFKQIAADLRDVAEGKIPSPVASPTPAPQPLAIVEANVPLAESANERARELVNLDGKFLQPGQIERMPQAASRYFRLRGWLTDELARQFCMGYLPRDVGEDRSGGTMRGLVVYPYCDEQGRLLSWFGRDPDWENKHGAWLASDRKGKEPQKFRFVKGFHKGLELFGQERIVAAQGETRELLGRLGLLLVEGSNDVMRLAALGVPAVALCGHEITREQAAKATRLARDRANGVATVFLDCNEEGERGMRQCLGYLAQIGPVRLAWTGKMYGGKFQGREVESLTGDEWQEIRDYLLKGNAEGWTLG
jgi:hypothetical protein